MRRPDEDYDVIVHCFGQRGSSDTGLPTWTIWLGGEKQGERVTLESALELARDVAAAYSRQAWLLGGCHRRGPPAPPHGCSLRRFLAGSGLPSMEPKAQRFLSGRPTAS